VTTSAGFCPKLSIADKAREKASVILTIIMKFEWERSVRGDLLQFRYG
jgi:hypothetical protein